MIVSKKHKNVNNSKGKTRDKKAGCMEKKPPLQKLHAGRSINLNQRLEP